MLLASEDWIPETWGDYRDTRYGAVLGEIETARLYAVGQMMAGHEVTLI